MPTPKHRSPEDDRLAETKNRIKNWRRWGPYLSERQWGTVREDYSPDGEAWNHFPHDHAPYRAYRWGEEGILGFCDRRARLCFSIALWNGHDPILKERLFGLSNPEGNHGEDAKEVWYYLDSTPTHSYAKGLYKYPQAAFPYDSLRAKNRARSRLEREFELHETGVFDHNAYFDVFVEYAKADAEDLLIRITVHNRAQHAAPLHLIPMLWFRNTWSWGPTEESTTNRPTLSLAAPQRIHASHEVLGTYSLHWDSSATPLFTENNTNLHHLYGVTNPSPFVKDGIQRTVIQGDTSASNPTIGTRAGLHHTLALGPLSSTTIRLRLRAETLPPLTNPFTDFDSTFALRIEEADAFYDARTPSNLSPDQVLVYRQAFAGLLWTKQYFRFVVPEWLSGDPLQPPPPPGRGAIRNGDWQHFHAADILSMPDKWEYPWFAAWDLAFHMLPMAEIDPDFAKSQLELLLREWYMHPSGKLPAYEWNFDDVNPPVHAWACWRVYKISARGDKRDRAFLERCFLKLLINFTWWVNRKDVNGRNIFAGGFLGLDNIGLFDRSKPLPEGHILAQADGTAWMAFYCGIMLSIAVELASENPVYEDIASKFFEHFVQIIDGINAIGESGLWDEDDGFYYDRILKPGTRSLPVRFRSMVGIIPLFAVEIIDPRVLDRLKGFRTRLEWFLKNRPHLAQHVEIKPRPDGSGELLLLSIVSPDRLQRVLHRVLDETEFLSPWGIRSVSRDLEKNPYRLEIAGQPYEMTYEPGESRSALFGGNSNWRGPIWFPVNYLLIEALERYHHFYGDSLSVELPTGSGRRASLMEVSNEICRRLSAIFTLNEKGFRPCFGDNVRYATDPHWRDCVLFHEYFHADVGCGLGANHQTGWTALITRCLAKAAR